MIIFYFLLLFFTCSIGAQEWINPTNQDVRTIFLQGMMDSQKQCAKFCGEKGMTATTGEHVICPTAKDLIYNPYIGKELDEIILHNEGQYSWYNPLNYIGMLQEWAFAKQRKNYKYIISGTQPGKPSVATHAIDFFKLNFGQERDIEECSAKIDACDKEFPNAQKILWGTSRGAAGWFNAHAHKKYDNVKMLVCEGCFDTVGHTIEKRTPWMLKKLGVHILFHYFLSAVTEYKVNGISPITSAEQFPEDVPLVFITSKADTDVAKECTYALMKKLKERNKNPIHCIKLNDSPHNYYSLGKGEDQNKYLRCMHRLYKKYKLPYIPQYAE